MAKFVYRIVCKLMITLSLAFSSPVNDTLTTSSLVPFEQLNNPLALVRHQNSCVIQIAFDLRLFRALYQN